MGGDDIFVLILVVGFAVVSVVALRGSRGVAQTPSVDAAGKPAGDKDARRGRR